MATQIRPAHPVPPTTEDIARWEHTRKARRILYSKWREDLEKLALIAIGNVRREAWKMLDLSANSLKAFMDILARTYDRPPEVGHGDPLGAENAQAVAAAGWWVRSQRRLRDTLGLQEMLVRVDVLPDSTPTYRLVFPDLVTSEADLDEPWKPASISEARLRRHPQTQELVWTWDHMDISGPIPVYKVLSADRERDDSLLYLTDKDGNPRGAFEGDEYPFRWPDTKKPLLPYAMYHAADVGSLWNWEANSELVEGTLIVGLYYSFFGHVLRSTAWAQRNMIDLDFVGADVKTSTDKDTTRPSVTTDPATVVRLKSTNEDRQGTTGQWSSPADPVTFLAAVRSYEQRMAQYVGVTGSDQIRMSGDPRSGFAVSVSREALREVQLRHEPMSRAGDEQLIAITAALRSIVTGRRIPTTGYSIAYQGIPKSAAERKADRDEMLELVDRDLLDIVAAYQQLHPHLTEAQAIAELMRIRELNREHKQAAPVGAGE